MSQNIQGKDYLSVQLCKNDRKKKVGVHILVAEAFHGKRPRGKFPNHKDLNRQNNTADNLEWVTRKQNARHAVQMGACGGRPLVGIANGRSKLTESQVILIRKLKGKIGQRDMATLTGVAKSLIQRIHQGKIWKHLQPNPRKTAGRKPSDLLAREFPTP